jgi:hypothetical protein
MLGMVGVHGELRANNYLLDEPETSSAPDMNRYKRERLQETLLARSIRFTSNFVDLEDNWCQEWYIQSSTSSFHLSKIAQYDR